MELRQERVSRGIACVLRREMRLLHRARLDRGRIALSVFCYRVARTRNPLTVERLAGEHTWLS